MQSFSGKPNAKNSSIFSKSSMNYNLKLILPLLLILILAKSDYCISQENDTLNRAKMYFEQKDFEKAAKLFEALNKNYPGNLNIQWLYAQSLYWSKEFSKSQKAYEEALAWHPENYYMMLDYALKLVDIGETQKALPFLNKYLKYEPEAPDVHNAFSKIAFWNAEYDVAQKENNKVLSTEPKNGDALDLRKYILQAKSPWLNINGYYNKDDQPIEKIFPAFEYGVWLSPLANLRVKFSSPFYKESGNNFNSQLLKFGNKFIFPKEDFDLYLEAGVVNLPDKKLSGTGELNLNKKFMRNLKLNLTALHKPYLYTPGNLDSSLMQMNFSVNVDWSDNESWQGHAGFGVDHFYSDGNYVYNTNAWILTPPLKYSTMEFRAGYGFNFSDSKENRYVSKLPLQDITKNWNENLYIEGEYIPYYTPNKHNVNSAIISILVNLMHNMSLSLRGNFGIYANARNPYLYLNNDEEGNIIISRGFVNEKYNPFETNASLNLLTNDNLSWKLEYNYLKTFFYKSQYAGLSVKIFFFNDKKKK